MKHGAPIDDSDMIATVTAHRIYKTVGVGVMPHEVGEIPDDVLAYINALAELLHGKRS